MCADPRIAIRSLLALRIPARFQLGEELDNRNIDGLQIASRAIDRHQRLIVVEGQIARRAITARYANQITTEYRRSIRQPRAIVEAFVDEGPLQAARVRPAADQQ